MIGGSSQTRQKGDYWMAEAAAKTVGTLRKIMGVGGGEGIGWYTVEDYGGSATAANGWYAVEDYCRK